MRTGFPTGTHRCRSTEDAHSLLGQRECAYRERHRFHKNSDIFVEASFELNLLQIIKYSTEFVITAL
jgi:hypothetical protein